MSKDNEKEKIEKYTLGYRIGEAFAVIIALCIAALAVSLTAGLIIRFFQWLL